MHNVRTGKIPFKKLSRLVGISPESARQATGRAIISNEEDLIARQQGRPRKFTDDEIDFMTSVEVLLKQSGMTLIERCSEFGRRFGLKVSVTTLRRMYKERHVQLKLGSLNNFYQAGSLDD